ncbi:transcriptional repressor TCF25-domain-containing protein [Sparassis latifolia]
MPLLLRQNQRRLKKKKKKPTAATPLSPSTPVQQPGAKPQDEHLSNAGQSKKERKVLKKQKAKDKGGTMDEVDKALAELSVKYPDLRHAVASGSASPAAREASSVLSSLLSVSLQYLDSEAEMRKFFGSKVVSAAKSSGSGSSSSSRRTVTQRSNLTRPRSTWWPAQMREGLSIRLLTEDEVQDMCRTHDWDQLPGERVWTVEYSKKYRGVTLAFMQTVMSGDPEGFNQILRLLPYHADTLLQLSEVYNHREEYSTGSDFIDRALFAYERAFVGSFNFTSGVNRLDFDRVENRPFFLAIHRQVSDLQRRGCVRTAFEFARLLYSLDPWTDPHGALLHLDYLSIKAGMGVWLLQLWDFFAMHAKEPEDFHSRLRVTVLPGWSYTRALALYIEEESNKEKTHERSTAALREAIVAFPSVVPLLADKADITLSAAVRGHKAFRVYTDANAVSTNEEAILQTLCHLYAQRSFSLWKSASRPSWFAQTVTSTLPSLPSSFNDNSALIAHFTSLYSRPALAYSIYRHVIVLETSCRSLFSFLPRSVTSSRHLACDPLPPPSRKNEYDAEFFKGAEDALAIRPRSRRASERTLERLIPDPVFRRQLQAFFEANPHFARRFPGGIIQFAQLAGELPEEVLEGLMIAEAAGGNQAEGGMPGQMPGEGIFVADFIDEEDGAEDQNNAQPVAAVPPPAPAVPPQVQEEDESGEDDEEEEDILLTRMCQPLPVRFLRTMMNRFWPAGAASPGTSSSEENEEVGEPLHRDDDGVD